MMRAPTKLIPISLLSIAFVVITWFIKLTANFMVPIVVGIILGILFSPLLLWLQKKKIPNTFSLIFILLVFIVLSLAFFFLLVSSLWTISNNFYEYQKKVLIIIDTIAPHIPFIRYDGLISIQNSIFKYIQDNFLSYSRTFLQSFAQIASQYIIIIFSMVFVLLERLGMYTKINFYLSYNEYESNRVSILISDINYQVSRFLFLKTIISFATATVVYIGFQFIGVDFSFMWAILTFLFNFIPTVGSILITLISIAFSIIQFFPDWTPVFLVVLVTTSTQMVIGNFLDPKIMGDNLNLSPLVIWFFLIYWGWVWGILGALLAVPLAVTIRIICEYVPHLNSIGMFMGSSRIMEKHLHSAKLKAEKEQQNL